MHGATFKQGQHIRRRNPETECIGTVVCVEESVGNEDAFAVIIKDHEGYTGKWWSDVIEPITDPNDILLCEVICS